MIQNFVKKFYIHDDNLPQRYLKIHHPLALKEQYTVQQISKSGPREICDPLQAAELAVRQGPESPCPEPVTSPQ